MNASCPPSISRLQVYLIGLPQEQSAAGKASKSDSYSLDKMSIRVSSKVFGARIR